MYLSVNELDISGALRITVTSSVLSTGFVIGVLGRTTIGVHGGEVESAVQTARKLRDVDVKGELLIKHVECLVVGLTAWRHEVNTGADVFLLAGGDKLESERIAAGGDTVGTCVWLSKKQTHCLETYRCNQHHPERNSERKL